MPMETDMTAFNKLVGLMKASGTLNNSPKVPGRTISPMPLHPAKDIPTQQKDLVQVTAYIIYYLNTFAT